jgi:exosome complex component MTR3
LDVFITVIECDGIENCLAASSIAATTALADAGIEMLGLVVACSAVGLSVLFKILMITLEQSTMDTGEIWLDPTASEASLARGSLTLACIPALGTVTNIWQTGKLSTQEVQDVSFVENI